MKTDARVCNKQSGVDKKQGWRDLEKHPEKSLEIQEDFHRRDDCMTQKGWKMTTRDCPLDER
jgi:hypothetical protein